MARYLLLTTIYGQSVGYGLRQHPRGLSICDTLGNAQSSPSNAAMGFGLTDVVFPALTNAPNGAIMVPMDAEGSAAMGGAPIVTLAELSTTPNPYGVGISGG
jgi:hypothetical protein